MVVSYFKITGHQLILIGHRLCVAVRSVNHHVGDQSAIRGKKVRQWGVTPRKSLHHIEPQILNIYLLTSNLWQYVSDLTQIATSFIFPIAPGIQAHSNHCDPGQALLSNASASMILATVSWQGN